MMINRHDEARLKDKFEEQDTPVVKRMPKGGDCQFCLYRWSDEKPTNNHSFIKGCKGVYFEGVTIEHCDDFKWWYE